MFMTTTELFQAGKLEEAIDAVGAELKKSPLDVRRRTFLFELLCFSGEYDRAEKQLALLEDQNKDAALGGLLYRGAIHAERLRAEMFEQERFPLDSVPPSPVRGTLNGRSFALLEDADPRIGARLEVFAAGDYMWIAFQDIALLEIDQPKRLRDLLWTPARLKTGPSFKDRDLGEILLPSLSPLTYQHPDGEVRLGRSSEWCADEDGKQAPYGAKLLLVDGEEVPLLEIRRLEIEPAAA
jgi:type VI secretion system protein ImpE